ncbi:hypothetical protein CPB86DRAFT_706152, partial [Serendipita vermifera]
DPNQFKNRIPTGIEEMVLLELIKKEEREVARLDSKVSSLQPEAETYKVAVQESELVLRAATKLLKCTEISHFALHGINDSLLGLRGRDSPVPTGDISLTSNPLYREIAFDGMILESTRDDHIESTRSVFERASQRVRQAETELDSNQSMLYFINQSIDNALELQVKVKHQLYRMKELMGARRRMPNELWIQVFRERVKEDEEKYEASDREEKPPFSSLKLTWICRSWRVLVVDCPMLWRYIAIPRTSHVSPTQWDRLTYFLERLKSIPAIVYTTRDSPDNTSSPLSELLRVIHSFERLEMNVSRRHSMTEQFLDVVQPVVQKLTLVGTFKYGQAVTACPLNFRSLRNVNSLSCRSVQPLFRPTSLLQDVPLRLTSVSLAQSYIDKRVTLSFLEAATSVTSVTLNLTVPYTIAGDSSQPVITLPHITTLSGNPVVLSTVFDELVELPKLCTVMLRLEPLVDMSEGIEQWNRFVSTHQRKDTIDTLGLAAGAILGSHYRMLGFMTRLIQVVPQVRCLKLEGSVVFPTLEILVLKKLVPKLVQLIISNDIIVTEDYITAFLNAFRKERNVSLSLQIIYCPSIPEPIKWQLTTRG